MFLQSYRNTNDKLYEKITQLSLTSHRFHSNMLSSEHIVFQNCTSLKEFMSSITLIYELSCDDEWSDPLTTKLIKATVLFKL